MESQEPLNPIMTLTLSLICTPTLNLILALTQTLAKEEDTSFCGIGLRSTVRVGLGSRMRAELG